MILKRQKILVGLLEKLGGMLTSTEMMKFLFLMTQEQVEKSYGFVPYKFGCFSFQAYADRRSLIRNGLLVVDDNSWKLGTSCKDILGGLSNVDRDAIWKIWREYGQLRGDELVKFVYRRYPYFAINSEIAPRIMNREELAEIEKARPRNSTAALYTIGYEGKDLDRFLDVLIREDIRLLCDVRRNPQSRKYGFSQKTLSNALEQTGIGYLHFPQLGVPSEERQELNTQEDYDRLFVEYERRVLANEKNALKEIAELVGKKKRVALVCYEKLPQQCHRSRVSNGVLRWARPDLKVKNL